MNAAKDFVSYLVRAGQIPQADVPEDVKAKAIEESTNEESVENNGGQQPKQVFQVMF